MKRRTYELTTRWGGANYCKLCRYNVPFLVGGCGWISGCAATHRWLYGRLLTLSVRPNRGCQWPKMRGGCTLICVSDRLHAGGASILRLGFPLILEIWDEHTGCVRLNLGWWTTTCEQRSGFMTFQYDCQMVVWSILLVMSYLVISVCIGQNWRATQNNSHFWAIPI